MHKETYKSNRQKGTRQIVTFELSASNYAKLENMSKQSGTSPEKFVQKMFSEFLAIHG